MDIGKTPGQIAATEEWRKSEARTKEKQAGEYAEWRRNGWSAFQIIVVILLAWIAINIELVVRGIVGAGVRVVG